jgi:hypothetical protein
MAEGRPQGDMSGASRSPPRRTETGRCGDQLRRQLMCAAHFTGPSSHSGLRFQVSSFIPCRAKRGVFSLQSSPREVRSTLHRAVLSLRPQVSGLILHPCSRLHAPCSMPTRPLAGALGFSEFPIPIIPHSALSILNYFSLPFCIVNYSFPVGPLGRPETFSKLFLDICQPIAKLL